VLDRLFISLAIKDNERKRLSITALFAFIIGLVQLFSITIPLSLFLATYTTDLLPYIYIGSAVSTILTGFIFTTFQKKAKVLILITDILYTCAIVLFVFWLLLEFTSAKPVILFFFVSCWVIFEFCNLVMTCLEGYLFTFEEGKRLNGILTSVRAGGGVVAGLISPLIVYFINTKHFALIMAGALCLALVIFKKIKMNYFTGVINNSSDDEDCNSIVDYKSPPLYKNSYLILIFLFSALTIFEYYSLNMMFNQVVKMRYTNENELTGFLGIFFSAVDILSMIIGVYAFNKINEKFGVIFSLQLMPTIVGIFTAIVIGINSFFPNLITPIFILVALTFLLDESLRASFNDEIIALLYQPLSMKDKSMAQVLSGLFVVPGAMGAIGIILLIFDHVFVMSVTKLGIMILALSVLTWMLLWPIRNGFIKTLNAAVKKRKINQMDYLGLERIPIAELKKYLRSDRDNEVISVLSYFNKFNKTLLKEEFPHSLIHSSKIVQKYTLGKIIENDYKELFDVLVNIVKTTDDNDIKSLAIIAIGMQRSDISDRLLLDFLSQDDTLIMSSAIVGLVKYRSTQQNKAIVQLKRLLNSEISEEKILGAQIIDQCNRQYLSLDLLPLMEDANPLVRIAASKASIHLMNRELFLAIANNLRDKSTRKSHLHHLVKAGYKVIPLFITEFAYLRKDIRSILVDIVDSLQVGEFISFILSHLNNPDNHVRHKIICTLSKCNFNALPEKINRKIIEQLALEKIFISRLHILLNLFSRLDKTGLAQSFLLRELDLSKERMINLLSCFYNQKQFLRILEAMQSGDNVFYGYAYELLFQLLSSKHKQEYLSCFQLSETNLSSEIDDKFIENILVTKKMFAIPSTNAVILYCLSTMGIIRKDLEKFDIDNEDIVQLETYHWVVNNSRDNYLYNL
jgi:hypothetical protein